MTLSFLHFLLLHKIAFLVSESVMATTALTARARPKRKRAEISYYESSDEDEKTIKYPDSDEELSTRAKKVCNGVSAIFGRYVFI